MSAVSTLVLAGSLSSAKADVYVWEDPDTRVTISYPDRWEPQGGLVAPDIYRLIVDGDDKAECTLSAHTDRRFLIYPRKYMDDAVRKEVDNDYWHTHFSNVDNLEFDYIREGGLGFGDARVAMVTFDRTVGENITRKTAITFASVYGDQQVVFQCESNAAVFDEYKDVFGSVVDSIEFAPKYQMEKQGMYRDFFKE